MKKLLIIPMLFACYMVMGQDAAKIIGTPYQLNNIEVAQHDFPNAQNWKDAIAKCNKLGEGWRLPTKDELNKLYNNKKKIGGFKDSYLDDFYWSSLRRKKTSSLRARISSMAIRALPISTSKSMFAPLGLNNY